MPGKALVVDANILIRAALGKRVRKVIETYAGQVSFFVPEVAYAEAEEHLPALAIKRGGDPEKVLAFLRSLAHLIEPIGSEVYGEFEAEARERLGGAGSGRLADFGLRFGSRLSSGPKIPISLGAECPLGLPAASRCICAILKNNQGCKGTESDRRTVGRVGCRLGLRQAWWRAWNWRNDRATNQ